jgi:hypothetical protein
VSETDRALPDVDAGELAERLRGLRARFVEFRGRL